MKKLFLFLLLVLSCPAHAETSRLLGVEWKSCRALRKHCYQVSAEEMSSSIMMKKFFARKVKLQIMVSASKFITFDAPFAIWSDDTKIWTLMQARSDRNPQHQRDLNFSEKDRRVMAIL